MAKKKKRITDSMVVPADGRPEQVKVGYRTIKIKYVRPDFIMDDMTDSYGEYRAERGSSMFKTHWYRKNVAIQRGMKFYMQWYISFLSTKRTDHSKKTTQKN